MQPHGLDVKNMWVDGCPSHLPALAELLAHRKGPVIEFGCGFYSTPLIAALAPLQHVIVEPQGPFRTFFIRTYPDLRFNVKPLVFNGGGRAFITPEYFGLGPGLKRWGIAFVDSRPSNERANLIRSLSPICDFVVVHDTERKREHLYPGVEQQLNMYLHRFDFDMYTPATTVVSETEDLDWLRRKYRGWRTDLDSEDIERNHKV